MNTLEGQVKFHELQAMWWMNAATNGHYKTMKICHGDGVPLSEQELVTHCMEISQTHIRLVYELVEELLG